MPVIPEHDTYAQHLTAPALAARWGVTVGHLANERSRGAGPIYLKIGGRVLYRTDDVAAFEAARVVLPVAA